MNEPVSHTTCIDPSRSLQVDEDLLDYFERAEDGAQMLFEIRYVEGQARAAAARLIYERRLDVRMCTILARTMKEYERGRDGCVEASFFNGPFPICFFVVDRVYAFFLMSM